MSPDELRARLTAAFKVEYAERQAARPPGLTASSVGGCSSYAARKILAQPERTSGDVWRSLRGIALHDFVLDLLARQDDGFEDGRAGRFTWDNGRLPVTGEWDLGFDGTTHVEMKTRSRDTCRWHADHGADPQEAMQVATAAVSRGCTEAFVVYLPTDSGLEEMAVAVVDVAHWHREALAWLERVDVRAEVEGLVARGIPRREAERRVLDSVPREPSLSWCKMFCLAGETEVVTRDGIRPIAGLARQGSADLLVPSRQGGGFTYHGQWAVCDVRSFGTQRLYRVELHRGRSVKIVHATAEHRWIPDLSSAFVTTRELTPGMALRTVRRNNVSRLREAPFAVAQGFVYGDGNNARDGAMSTLTVFDNSNKAVMLDYFRHTHELQRLDLIQKGWRVPMLPPSWKQLPSLREPRSFLLSWLAGYLAADGSVTKGGQVTIASADIHALEFVRSLCAVVGVGTGTIHSRSRLGINQAAPSLIHALPIRTRDLPLWCFKLPHHAERAERAQARPPRELAWRVASVEPTDRVEEVFCAVVPGVEAFGLADELLTGNCGFLADCRGDYAPPPDMEIPDPTMRTAAQEAEHWRQVRLEAGRREKAALARLGHVEGTVHLPDGEHLRVHQQVTPPSDKRRGSVAPQVRRRKG